MRKRNQTYKCEVCGNIVSILHGGVGTLVCCNRSMRLLEENYEGPGQEKHIPIVTRNENGLSVIVGSNSHPMEKEHFIEWIEVISDKNIIREYLSPGSAPEAKFNLNDDNIIVREYCNVHGLWING